MTSPAMTAETIELLADVDPQRLHQRRHAELGLRASQRRHPSRVPRRRRVRRGTLRADRRPGVARRSDGGPRPERAEPVPDGPHRRGAGEPRGLEPRSVRRRARRRPGRRRGVGSRRDRHAQHHVVDGGRLPPARTRRIPTARRPHLLRRCRRGIGQRARRPVDGRPRARCHPGRLRAHRERRTSLGTERRLPMSASTWARRAWRGDGCACGARRDTGPRRSAATTRW